MGALHVNGNGENCGRPRDHGGHGHREKWKLWRDTTSNPLTHSIRPQHSISPPHPSPWRGCLVCTGSPSPRPTERGLGAKALMLAEHP